MDTKKNMSREQLLAYMRDNCTEAEAQQVCMWLRGICIRTCTQHTIVLKH